MKAILLLLLLSGCMSTKISGDCEVVIETSAKTVMQCKEGGTIERTKLDQPTM